MRSLLAAYWSNLLYRVRRKGVVSSASPRLVPIPIGSIMEGSDPAISATNLGGEDLGIDSTILYETVTDAVAHCAAGAYLAVQAFVQSCRSPVVLDTIKSTSKTVVITAICHYVLLKLILWPVGLLFRLFNLVTFFRFQLDASVVVKRSMSIYPLLTILLIRHVYRSSMDTCFKTTLQKLDPKYAAHLADKPRLFKATMTERVLVKLGITGDDSDDLKTVVLLMVAGMLLRGWKAVPYVGWVVAPVVHFLSIRYMVGHVYAAASFSVLAAVSPGLERPVLTIVELWASSKVLGRSSMRYFMDRMVPRRKRYAFVRAFEYTIVSYFMLPTALMRLPLLGSMVAFPAASLGAYALKDILSRKSGVAEAFEHL